MPEQKENDIPLWARQALGRGDNVATSTSQTIVPTGTNMPRWAMETLEETARETDLPQNTVFKPSVIDRYVEEEDPDSESLRLFTENQSPTQRLGFDDVGPGSFLKNAERTVRGIGEAAVDMVNFLESDISGKERLARAATAASFFVPIAAGPTILARLGLGFARTFAGRVAITAAQEAAIGAGISALHGESATTGAAIGGGVGALFAGVLTKGRLRFLRGTRRAAREALEDSQNFTKLGKTPLVTEDYAIISGMKRELPDALNGEKTARLYDELTARGYEPIPMEMYFPMREGETLARRFKSDAFIVPGMRSEEALDIASRMEQTHVSTRKGLFNLEDGTFKPLLPEDIRFNRSVHKGKDVFGRLELTTPAGKAKQKLFSLGYGEAEDLKAFMRDTSGASTEHGLLREMWTEPTQTTLMREKLGQIPWRSKMHLWYSDLVRNFHGFEIVDKAFRGKDIAKTAVRDSLTKMVQLFGGANGVAQHTIEHAMVASDDVFKPIARSFQDLFKPVKDQYEAFVDYGFARRFLAVGDMGKKLPRKPGSAERWTREELLHTVNSAPENFRKTFDDIVDWRNDFLEEWLGKTGVLSEDAVEKILTSKDYVPLRRALDDIAERAHTGAPEDFFAIFDPIKKLERVEGRFQAWPEVLQREVVLFTRLGKQQQVMSKLIREMEEMPEEFMSQFLKKQKGTPTKLSAAKKELIETLKGTDPGLAESVAELDEEILSLISPNIFMKDDRFIGTLIDGKRTWYEVKDKLLWNAVNSMNPAELSMMTKIMRLPSSWLRTGATLSLEFMSRNPLRDMAFAAVTAGRTVKDVVTALPRFTEGLASSWNQDEWYKLWTRAGGQRAALVSMDRNMTRKHLKEFIEDGKRFPNVIKDIPDGLRALSELSESGTRLGLFKQEMRRMISEVSEAEITSFRGVDDLLEKTKLTSRQLSGMAEEAALKSRSGSVDFAVHGAKTGAIRQTTAFWNAALQGWDTMIRQAKRDPLGFSRRAVAGITLPSVALYMVNRQDPEWRDIPEWEKNIFWHVKIGDQWTRFPKPFELGMIFGTSVERMMEAMDNDDPKMLDEAWAKQAKDFSKDLLPLPTAIRPIVERVMNFNLFTERPIISRGQEQVAKKFRETPGTSEISQLFVKKARLDAVGLDAITIDHVFESYTGTLGRYAIEDFGDLLIQATGLGEVPTAPSTRIRDLPLFKGFISRFPEDNEATERFYRTLTQIREAVTTSNKLERELYLEDLEEYLRENMELIGASPTMERFARQLTEMRKQRQRVEADPNLPRKAKRVMLESMTETMYEYIRSTGPLMEMLEESQEE